MAKIKSRACRLCKIIYEDVERCPHCDSKEFTDSYKGRIVVLDYQKSLIAEKLNIKSEGNFAIKTR